MAIVSLLVSRITLKLIALIGVWNLLKIFFGDGRVCVCVCVFFNCTG